MTAPVSQLFQMPEESGDWQAQKRVEKWCCIGIPGRELALNYALSGIPAYLTTEALYRQNVTQNGGGADLWYFEVEYGPIPKGIAEWRFTADTTGGTAKLKNSIQCVSVYPPT